MQIWSLQNLLLFSKKCWNSYLIIILFIFNNRQDRNVSAVRMYGARVGHRHYPPLQILPHMPVPPSLFNSLGEAGKMGFPCVELKVLRTFPVIGQLTIGRISCVLCWIHQEKQTNRPHSTQERWGGAATCGETGSRNSTHHPMFWQCVGP